MQDWDDLRFVLAIHRGGSLAGAARQLRVDATTVGRRIDQLEQTLGTPLFVRRRGAWRTTLAGTRVIEAAVRAERAIQDAEDAAREADVVPSGRVTLTTVEAVASWLVTPLLPAFLAAHPRVEVSLSTTTRVLDLGAGEADLAIRIGRPTAADHTARRLGGFTEVPCASREWLEQRGLTAASLTDLGGAPLCIMSSTGHRKALETVGGGPVAVRVTSTGPLMEGVALGLGVGLLPGRLAERDPRLVPLHGLGLRRERDLWLVFPPEVARRAAVRVLIDAIVDGLSRG